MQAQEISALNITQLCVNYEKTPVLWNIALNIPPGKLIGIIGPNGAGKSTLIKSILNIVPRSSGKILFFNKPLESIRNKICFVPQKESVDWDFPICVRDLALLGRYGKLGLCRRPSKLDKEIAHHYLQQLGIENLAQKHIAELSGGQQQRAFIARALCQEADIFFLDEPFAGVDLATEASLIALFKQLRDKGKTIFIVHHDLTTAARYFDWAIILNRSLIASGPIKEVFSTETLFKAYGRKDTSFEESLSFTSTEPFARDM